MRMPISVTLIDAEFAAPSFFGFWRLIGLYVSARPEPRVAAMHRTCCTGAARHEVGDAIAGSELVGQRCEVEGLAVMAPWSGSLIRVGRRASGPDIGVERRGQRLV